MRMDINRIVFTIMCSISIGLGTFATALSLIANIKFLVYVLSILTVVSGFLLVKVNKNPLSIYNKKD